MVRMAVGRRQFLGSAGAAGIAASLPLGSTSAAATDYVPMRLPPPISSEERVQRLARARALMKQNGIGAVIIEPGASLDYFTGVQWWRS